MTLLCSMNHVAVTIRSLTSLPSTETFGGGDASKRDPSSCSYAVMISRKSAKSSACKPPVSKMPSVYENLWEVMGMALTSVVQHTLLSEHSSRGGTLTGLIA